MTPWVGPVPEDLVARDEEVEVDARREFYENIKTGKERVERWRMMGLLIIKKLSFISSYSSQGGPASYDGNFLYPVLGIWLVSLFLENHTVCL